ncbi:hypothetical protein V6O07_19555, partial [Arthrospira platensis SPKY2]
YHPDNSLTLEPYNSALTDRVVSTLLYPRVRPYWTHCGSMVAGRVYYTPNTFHVSPTNEMSGHKPFVVSYLDRKQGNAALKESRFTEFKLWLDTLIRLNLDPRKVVAKWDSLLCSGSTLILDCLQRGPMDPMGWPTLVTRMSTTISVAVYYRYMREHVYSEYMCYEDTTYDSFAGWQEFINARKQKGRV